jgi:N-alpha-acetyltransferase 50
LLSLRSKIELGDVTQHNIRQLKKLNQVVFPVSYNDKFYKDVLEAGELAKLGIQFVIAGTNSKCT